MAHWIKITNSRTKFTSDQTLQYLYIRFFVFATIPLNSGTYLFSFEFVLILTHIVPVTNSTIHTLKKTLILKTKNLIYNRAFAKEKYNSWAILRRVQVLDLRRSTKIRLPVSTVESGISYK